MLGHCLGLTSMHAPALAACSYGGAGANAYGVAVQDVQAVRRGCTCAYIMITILVYSET